jgi:hypothetical protein
MKLFQFAISAGLSDLYPASALDARPLDAAIHNCHAGG